MQPDRRRTQPYTGSLRAALRVIAAEALKQHRILFGSKLIYCSLLLWPALQLATAYYTLGCFSVRPELPSGGR
jgi:ABC-2 type transport system permease protein